MRRPGGLGVPLSVAPRLPAHEPDLSPEHKAAVVAALRLAWDGLSRREPELLRSAPEEDITTALQRILNKKRNGRAELPYLADFETVTRGENQETADGRNGKKPDLTFRPPTYRGVVDGTAWGWFVECKIIDGTSSVTLYLKKGIHRFCVGEYGARMPSAAMLGYVRDRTTPAPVLAARLEGHAATTATRPRAAADESDSEHPRGGLAQPCVDITLTHLWLCVPECEPAALEPSSRTSSRTGQRR